MKKLLFYLLLFISISSYAQVEANDDNFTVPSFAFGTIGNVLSFDFLDGNNIYNPSDVILTFDNSSAPTISINSNGDVVFWGAPSGSHIISYTICRTSNPTECDTALVFIYVNPTVDAVNDSFVLATAGTTNSSVLVNDTQDGIPVLLNQVTVIPNSTLPHPGITLDSTGFITVASYVPAGIYYLDYQLCYIGSYPPSCDVATVSIEVQSSNNSGVIGCNISTGIDGNGNPLPDNAVDPFWRIANSPNPPGTPALVQYSFPGYWMPTPEPTTFARWLNASGNFNDVPGNYTFERDIIVPAGSTSLDLNFSITWDDTFVSLELVRPDLSTIPLSVTPPSTWYYLTPAINYSEASPMAGTWKIRVVVNFYDQIGAFLLSGCANVNCQTLYVDNDNDGYDNGSIIECSGTIPTGYSSTTLGTDCDDSNASIGTAFTLPLNLQTGLLAQYTFNGGNTGDFSGNGHHLININTALPATDRNGNAKCAIEFDNLPTTNNQYLTTTSTTFLNGLSGYSVSCWYMAKDASRPISTYEVLVGRDTSTTNCPDRQGQWSLALYDCRKAVFARENSVWETTACLNEVNVWHHLTTTYDQASNTIKLYKDGVLQGTKIGPENCGSQPVPPALDLGDLFLGKNFTGILDDVFIHNREITAAEVTQLYGLGSSCCSSAPCGTLITPLFNTVAPICAGDVLTALPLTSSNGITGTWSPALDNSTTTTYTFTPNPGQCASSSTMTIVVNPSLVPNFIGYSTLCQNNPAPILPTVSLEGITGTWSPTSIDTSAVGTYLYVFTPDAGQCASSTTMNIVVNPNDNPIFNPVAPICVGDTLADLPITSINGINGSWLPALDNTTTTTYTFTPDAGQCATSTTLTITVNPESTNITTITNCSSYTWPVNGVTYTTSGVYSEIVGCTIGLLYLTINTPTTWYIDADGDGAGNPAISIVDCVQPTGYVDNDNDCDDTNATINPCAIENRTDGIDNNCNGFVDEITTRLVASQCGITMASINQLLVAQSVSIPGSTICGYRFQVTKWIGGAPSTNPSDVQTITRSANTFALTMLAQYAYNTTYSVQVSVCVNGVWQPYSADCCTVRCDKLSKVRASQCGTTISSMTTWVYADFFNFVKPASFVPTYVKPWRFEITQVSPGPGFGVVQTYDNQLNQFKMTDLSSATLNTTYSVRVAFLNVDGTWSSFGLPCTITTPAAKRLSDDVAIQSIPFEAIVYPNPTDDVFRIDIKTGSNNPIFIQVYDLLGRLVEDKQTTIDEIDNLQLGNSYPSGVYQVIIKQESNTKALKVVKR